MDQFANRSRFGRTLTPEPPRQIHGVPDEYVASLSGLSNAAISVLHADNVAPEFALKLTPDRTVYDIVVLWRRSVLPEYALTFSDRRDLTVFDIIDMWEAGVPAEFAVLT